jgi:transcriptional regulator with XRE-family HTH domain
MHAIITPMNTGRLLRSARRRAGLSQRQLAAAAGVPQATVGRIEAGIVSPRTDTLSTLLRAAGAELAVLPRLGEGVDRTLIRDRLRLTPEERIRRAVEEARAMPELKLRK